MFSKLLTLKKEKYIIKLPKGTENKIFLRNKMKRFLSNHNLFFHSLIEGGT